MFTLLNADYDDEESEITDPQEVAELFAAIAAIMVDANGASQARQMLEAVIEQEGREPS